MVRPWLMVLALGLLLGSRAPVHAAPGRVLVLVLDQVNWWELHQVAREWPHLGYLLGRGAVGLMNSRKPGERNYYNAYLTLGAGGGVTAPPALGELQARPAGEAWHFGLAPPQWQQVLLANRQAGGNGLPGLLQASLAAQGQPAQIIADGAGPGLLPAALLLEGRGGATGYLVGKRDLAAWVQRTEQALAVSPLALLVWTEGARPNQLPRQPLPPPPAKLLPEGMPTVRPVRPPFAGLAGLRVADALLGRLLTGTLDLRRDRVVVMSIGTPPYAHEQEHSLAPVVMAGAGVQAGLLTSASTRRPGVVVTTDFAPSVLDFLGLPVPACMSGHPWRVVPTPDAPAQLDRLHRQTVITYRLRFPLVRSFILFQGMAVILVTGLLWLRPGAAAARRRWLRGLLLFALAQPLALLVLGATGVETTAAALGLAAGIAGVLAGLASLLPGLYPVAALTGLTALALSADTLAGSPFMRTSVLGYDPILGARFYGLGNEYMGILVAAAGMAGACLLAGRRWLPVLAVLFLAVVAVVGLPQWGANWGGGMTAGAGLGATFLVLAAGRPRRWHVPALLGGLVAVGLGLVGMDLLHPAGQRSHIGQMVGLASQAGWQSVWDAVRRKALMSWRLLFFSRWNWFFVMVLVLVGRELARPRLFAAAFARWRGPYAGVVGGLVTAVVALVCNDSGIVAGASSLMVTAGALLYLGVALAEEKGP